MRKIILILVAVVLPLITWGKNNVKKGDNYHFGYISASAGYSSLSQSVQNVSTKGDFAYLVGAGYEFRVKSYWLSIGAQYQSLESETKVNEWSPSEDYKGIDDQGKRVSYPYEINQTDHQQWHSIDIPLMMGYYYKGFYVGGGAKVGFSMGSTITTSGTYELIGDYDDYVGEFRDVHYYTTYEQEPTKFKVDLRPQFSILGEIGYDLLSPMPTNSTICHVLKLGFYFEYGLRSVRPQDSMESLTIDPNDVTVATINPYYLSSATSGERIVPYYVGVKLTYLIGGNRNGSGTWHRGCQCYGK